MKRYVKYFCECNGEELEKVINRYARNYRVEIVQVSYSYSSEIFASSNKAMVVFEETKFKNYNDYELISMVRENDEFSYYSLFEKYKPIVKNISKEFYDRYSDYGYDYDDFIQEGYVGFQNALNKYDSSKGALFYTFVELCIRRRLLSFTKNITLPKRNISNKYFVSLDDLDVRDNSVSLNDELDYEDTMNTIKDVLYSLDLKYTAPFELKMNNFSLKEISILLEVSINSVSYRVNLVRDEIRTRILCE